MMTRTLLTGLAAALTAGFAGLPAAEAAKSRNCGPAVDQHLAELGVPQSDVERILIEARVRTRSSGSKLVGYDAWVNLKSCAKGQLVISMNRQCSVKTAYTTGDCKVPGVDD